MTITAKNSTGIIEVLTTDTVIIETPSKVGIEAFSAHNTTGSDVTVEFFISNNNTSELTERVCNYTIKANEQLDINAIIGQGYNSNLWILAKASAVGINCYLTYTEFTED